MWHGPAAVTAHDRKALYRLVQLHLETWLARRREHDPDGAPIPRHVEHLLPRVPVRQ